MYETIYVEKNKSSHFGIHFYNDSTQWQTFCKNCEIKEKNPAVICNEFLESKAWNAFVSSCKQVLKLTANASDNHTKLRQFFNENTGNTFIIFSEPFIMNAIQAVISANESKLSYVLIPVTPFAFFDAVSIKPQTDDKGELITKELFPIGVYADTSILSCAATKDFLGGIAAAFRLAISYKASLFEWMISNLYELLDCEEAAIIELLARGYKVQKERIEKDTARERSLPVYASAFYNVLSKSNLNISEADLWALAMVCQTYLSWKSELLSMEEYYEIRDMFVAFGLAITETDATDAELMQIMNASEYNLLKEKETVLIRKLGKVILHEIPTTELIQEAFAQIYFNETDNE